MRTADAERVFRERLRKRGLTPESTTPRSGLDALLSFYREVRASDVELAQDGDMLIYQWGVYDWGDGERFELGLTRQLICGSGGDDDIWQLSLAYRYPQSNELSELGSGASDWFSDPDDLGELIAFIEESAPYQRLADEPALEVHTEHAPVG
jgi:hypothetical protein